MRNKKLSLGPAGERPRTGVFRGGTVFALTL